MPLDPSCTICHRTSPAGTAVCPGCGAALPIGDFVEVDRPPDAAAGGLASAAQPRASTNPLLTSGDLPPMVQAIGAPGVPPLSPGRYDFNIEAIARRARELFEKSGSGGAALAAACRSLYPDSAGAAEEFLQRHYWKMRQLATSDAGTLERMARSRTTLTVSLQQSGGSFTKEVSFNTITPDGVRVTTQMSSTEMRTILSNAGPMLDGSRSSSTATVAATGAGMEQALDNLLAPGALDNIPVDMQRAVLVELRTRYPDLAGKIDARLMALPAADAPTRSGLFFKFEGGRVVARTWLWLVVAILSFLAARWVLQMMGFKFLG